MLKRLPLHRRPFFARTILEVGGGHAPYAGVTHAVDKYPQSNTQRAGDLAVSEGVEFLEGDLEEIPFRPEGKFDFLYASHVLEHVNEPARAVAEINRVAKRGYLATPSPLREQISCPYPFAGAEDFHTHFCWTVAGSGAVHVARKTAERIGEYCDCADGRLGAELFKLRRESGRDLEPLLPRSAKETSLYFHAPLTLVMHEDFRSACRSGACAYGSARAVRFWSAFPMRWVSRRFQALAATLRERC